MALIDIKYNTVYQNIINKIESKYSFIYETDLALYNSNIYTELSNSGCLCIKFHDYDFNHNINKEYNICELNIIKGNNLIPENIKVIDISLYKHKSDILDFLPSKLQFLIISNYIFYKPIDYLPINLESLVIPMTYKFSYINYPTNLQDLVLNCDINLNDLPSNLKKLSISCNEIKNPIVSLPLSLNILEIKTGYCKIEKLPNKLKQFTLNICNDLYNNIKLPICCNLPSSLEYLYTDIYLINNIFNKISKSNKLNVTDFYGNNNEIYQTTLKKLIIIHYNKKLSLNNIPFIIKELDINDISIELNFN